MQKSNQSIGAYIIGGEPNSEFEFPDPVDIPELYKSQPEPDVILVQDFMPYEGGVAILHGDGGSGKSYVAQELAVALSTGTPFLGRFPVDGERPRHVAWIDMDQGEKTVMKRLRRRIGCPDLAPERDRDYAPEELESDTALGDYWRGPDALTALEEHLHMFIFDGRPFSLLSGPNYNPREKTYLDAFGAMLVTYNIEILVIDALVRVLGGANENDSATADEFFRRMRAFQRHVRMQTGKPLTSIVIHHDRKPGVEPDAQSAKKYRARGSSAWRDACELQLGAELLDRQGVVMLSVNKDRHTDDSPGNIHHAKFENAYDFEGNILSKRLVYHAGKTSPDVESQVLDLVKKSGRIGINPGGIESVLRAHGSKIKRNELNNVMYKLMDAGQVTSNVPLGSGSKNKRYFAPETDENASPLSTKQ